MDWLLYIPARALIFLLQSLPLGLVARIGRGGGALAYWLDGRHRRVAIKNLTASLGTEKTPEEITAIARENFRRIGETFASAMKTASMSLEQLQSHLEIVGADHILNSKTPKLVSRVVAIGHFGNFELFAHAAAMAPAYQGATTYRGLGSPALDRLLLKIREVSGCLYFERRTQGAALRAALREQTLLLGLLSDQHSGDHGLRLPFFGRDCTTTKAPAVFALRFNLPLHTAICYRVRPGHWRIEVGEEIPTQEKGEPRSPAAIMLDVNRAFETAVRRDPANWFWVHNRWKPEKTARLKKSPVKAVAEEADLELDDTKPKM